MLLFSFQLSDFKPVMKLFDLLYPEKQVGSVSHFVTFVFILNKVAKWVIFVSFWFVVQYYPYDNP